jgi:glycerol kinase
MSFVLALDQGTTSSRAIVFDHAGAIRGAAQKEFRQIFPQPGWVEHDPTEIWATQLGVAAEALASARIGTRDLAALGITISARPRCCGNAPAASRWPTPSSGRTAVLPPPATSCAPRPEPLFDARRAGARRIFGTKLKWLLDNVPGAREARYAASSRSAPSTPG